MKKIYLTFCFLISAVAVFAQKSYVYTGTFESHSSHLSGNFPVEINNFINKPIGELLNELSKYGYSVEFMTSVPFSGDNSNYQLSRFLLSKSSTPSSAIERHEVDNEDVTEVARYNLQGLPVNESEKGIQRGSREPKFQEDV